MCGPGKFKLISLQVPFFFWRNHILCFIFNVLFGFSVGRPVAPRLEYYFNYPGRMLLLARRGYNLRSFW